MEAASEAAVYRLKPGSLSPSGVAVAGLDGQLFISDGVNRSERQFLGELTVAPNLFEQRTLPITGRNTGTSFHLLNTEALDPRRVLVFGDSFGPDEGLGAALSAVFREIRFFWSKEVSWSLVDGVGADLVIWESAERFLVTIPQA